MSRARNEHESKTDVVTPYQLDLAFVGQIGRAKPRIRSLWVMMPIGTSRFLASTMMSRPMSYVAILDAATRAVSPRPMTTGGRSMSESMRVSGSAFKSRS